MTFVQIYLKNMRTKHKLLLLLLFLTSLNALAQLSKKHYIPPLTNDDGFSDQYIYISTPKNQSVAYKITAIGQTDLPAYSGVVSNGSPVEQAVLNATGSPDFANGSQLQNPINNSGTVLNNKGFIIEAEDVIYVSIRVRSDGSQFHAGALVSKGTAALGNNFRIGGAIRQGTTVGGHANFASIMATEDNTVITIDDLPAGIVLNGPAITLPININLNEGESYVIASSVNNGGDPRDLVGGLITSDKPIVVNSGYATGSFGAGNGRDYGFDQIVDASKVGTEYIFVRGNGGNSPTGDTWENVLIVAHEDNTTISVNGNGVVTTINKGEYHVIEGGDYNGAGNMYVETSKPAFAYQGIGGQVNGEPNQGLFFVPPLSCENRGDVNNIADIDKIGNGTFNGGITIVTNVGAVITINGQPITNFAVQGPFAVDGNANYETYKVTGLTGNIEVQSDQELYCAYFNQNGFAASGSFYSGFPSNPEINFNATVMNLGNCIPNITLESGTIDALNSYEWFYDDGSGGGFVSTGVSGNAASSYTPTQPGDYKLVVTLSCSGATFESAVVPISLCPDDADGDLVIDNIDVDFDNDGILNCDESNGNAEINLSNINSPTSPVQSNPINSAIGISGNFTESNTGTGTNTFTGSANGDFVSTVTEGTTSLVNYDLTFTEPINFKFTEAAGVTHTPVDGEVFIIKTTPNNKNITLLDPDDLLLVDTDFNGEFETGVTYVSSSEIRFKYKVGATGTTPYQFVANSVTSFSFEHNLSNTTTPTTFSGNIGLTCFARDTDGDGVEDAFDTDSDNDGVPDIIDNTGLFINLIGDSDLDGLDDAFNGVTVNIDSDNDGIPNAFDVDSDNDGIFDIIESGITLAQAATLDTNNDGIIDNFTDTNNNGLIDALESLTIADIDSDGIPNFIDLDSDADDCFDVSDAGFTDTNNDGLLGGLPINVDANGKVTSGTDGYTNPNSNYSTSAPITLNTPFQDQTFCELDTRTLTIDSTADTFQWQLSTNGGANWSNITNNAVYSNATTTSLQITNTPLSYNNYQYRVLLERNGNACGFTSNAITLTVNPLPIVNNTVQLKQCDDDADLMTTINLTEARLSISPNYVANMETFQYFATQADAIAGTPQVADELRYPVNGTGEAWVRTISNENCYVISKIDLVVSFAGNVTYDRTFTVCDDLLDADGNNTINNNDKDGISTFNFITATDEIKAFFPVAIRPNLEVIYYESAADRTASVNPIPDISNHRNNGDPAYANNQTIYARIVNTVNNDCTGTAELFLQVNSVPIANNPPTGFEFCDDNDSGSTIDGQNIGINLRDKVTDILGPTQNPADYIVSFHTTLADANDLTSTGIANDTNYTNVPQAGFNVGDVSMQTIFVRVQDRNANPACYNANDASFTITINPLPEISTTIDDLAICDVPNATDTDPRNRVAQNIDLTSKNAEILNGRTNHIVEYYTSAVNAQNRNPIANPSNYENDAALTAFPTDFNTDDPGIQTIFFRVIDQTGAMCESIFSTFNLSIYPEPNIPTNISDYTDCDNTSDSFGSDRNGINGDITLKNKIPEILANYPVSDFDDFSVTFYTSLAAAEMGNPADALNEDVYQNAANNETIFVRVENTKNTPVACIQTRLSFNINIQPLPIFTVMGEENVDDPQILCLNDTPLTLEAENAGAIYNYEWTDEAGATLGTNQTLDVTTGGKYTVTATDRVSLCTRSRTIVVKESNPATLQESFLTIIDESNNIGSQDNISIYINNVDNDLGPGDYQFAIINNDDNTRIPSIGYQDESLFENLEGGIYTIIVNDKNGCAPDATLTTSVIQFPKFFTPNGDGDNDTWVVKGANKTFYPNSSINIFDRFGKLVGQVPIDSQGWNGTFNGKLLPSDDYWYNITLIPANTNKPTILKKGNFSMLRK